MHHPSNGQPFECMPRSRVTQAASCVCHIRAAAAPTADAASTGMASRCRADNDGLCQGQALLAAVASEHAACQRRRRRLPLLAFHSRHISRSWALHSRPRHFIGGCQTPGLRDAGWPLQRRRKHVRAGRLRPGAAALLGRGGGPLTWPAAAAACASGAASASSSTAGGNEG